MRAKNKILNDALFIVIIVVMILVLFEIFKSIPALAQSPEFNRTFVPTDRWRKDGELVTVQISRGNPIRIFVVGREEAKLDLSKMKLTIRRMKPYPAKTLSVDQFNNYFVVNDSKEFDQAKDLEIITEVKGKEETFRFDMNKDLP